MWSNVALFKPVIVRRFQFVEHIVLLLSAEHHENSIFVHELSA
jgi:hypothetical protein